MLACMGGKVTLFQFCFLFEFVRYEINSSNDSHISQFFVCVKDCSDYFIIIFTLGSIWSLHYTLLSLLFTTAKPLSPRNLEQT